MRAYLALCLAIAACGDSGNGPGPDGPTGPDGAPGPDAGPPDAPLPPCDQCPRLVVADANGRVGIWNAAADLVGTEPVPDATLTGFDGAPRGVAVHGDRLIVISGGAEQPIAVFDGARALGSDGAPAVRYSASEVGASALDGLRGVHTDAAGNLWLLEGFGRVLLIKGGALGAPTGNAQFDHPWQQIASMAVAGGRLFAGQISGAGIIVWDDAASRSGPAGDPDWQLANLAPWAMVAGGNRLYAYDGGAGTRLAVWNDVDTLSWPRALDVEVALSPTQAVGHLAWRDDALIATIANGVTENRTAIFADSGALTPASTPDTEVAPAAADYLQESYLGRDGTLYVLDTDGVYIYRDALTAPTLVTKLTTLASPVGFAVIE